MDNKKMDEDKKRKIEELRKKIKEEIKDAILEKILKGAKELLDLEDKDKK